LLDGILPWAVGLGTLVARLVTAAAGPTDWDSSQYAAAITRFDVTHGRPQPPGYFLYVWAGRLVHATGPGAVRSLVIVSALASAVAAGLSVVAGRDLGGRWVGLAAGVLVASSPFAWFSGSVVSTYSFDLLVAPLLIVLAWRARPHSWHGAAALGSLGLAAGFRQSTLQVFALLALLAVAGSVRRAREALAAACIGLAAILVWFVPMSLAQPGGASAWTRATHAETVGAFRATSILDHAPGASTNLGTFAAYTVLALAPLAAFSLVSACVLGVRALRRSAVRSRDDAPSGDPAAGRLTAPHAGPSAVLSAGAVVPSIATPGWTRPWYQSRTVVLGAAIVPPVAVVVLVEFAKGGYLLAYLPGAVIALLLVPAALLPSRTTGERADSTTTVSTRIWLAIATLAVALIAALGAQRFLDGAGVLPGDRALVPQALWLTQARYQAPYPATRSAIRAADAIDRDLAAVAPYVHPGRDVVVIDSVDGGDVFYRNAGWELPLDRVALVVPGAAVYNEQFASLYYTSSSTVPVGPGGSAYLVASPSLPGLAQLAASGRAVQVDPPHAVAGYLVWRVAPGARILGVRVVVQPGIRPLGSGIPG
jgi:hypothetical protein